jgi:hypothetical protein
VLFAEFLGQRRAHDLLAKVRRGREVSLSALSAGRANVYWIKRKGVWLEQFGRVVSTVD